MSTTCEIRPGRADMTTTRVDRKTASGMLWVTNTIVVPVRRQMLISSAFIRSRVISSRAPNGSSISSSFGSNERARAIATRCCIPPDSSQGWRSANASKFDELEQVGGATMALLGREAHDLERQLDVSRDGPPVHQDRCLEDHPVVAVQTGLFGRLAVDREGPAGRPGQVADDPEQRGLAAPAGTDERHELALADGQVDRFECGHGAIARPEHLADAGRLDHDRLVRGVVARCRLRGHRSPSTGR